MRIVNGSVREIHFDQDWNSTALEEILVRNIKHLSCRGISLEQILLLPSLISQSGLVLSLIVHHLSHIGTLIPNLHHLIASLVIVFSHVASRFLRLYCELLFLQISRLQLLLHLFCLFLHLVREHFWPSSTSLAIIITHLVVIRIRIHRMNLVMIEALLLLFSETHAVHI